MMASMDALTVVWNGRRDDPDRGLLTVPVHPWRTAPRRGEPKCLPDYRTLWEDEMECRPVRRRILPTASIFRVDDCVGADWLEQIEIATLARVPQRTARLRLRQLIDFGIVERRERPALSHGRTVYRAIYRKVA